MLLTKLRNDGGEDLGKTSCTTEIQAAFILSSFLTFFSGLLVLFIFRIIWKIIKKWQNIKGTGIILVSFLIWDPTVWRSDRFDMCLCLENKASLSFHRLAGRGSHPDLVPTLGWETGPRPLIPRTSGTGPGLLFHHLEKKSLVWLMMNVSSRNRGSLKKNPQTLPLFWILKSQLC